MNNWVAIVNPNAGSGKVRKLERLIQSSFTKAGINVEWLVTPQLQELTDVVRTKLQNGERRFIAVGGDGTLHHLVNAILNQREVNTKDVCIAIIPVGTGNDFVRSLNWPNKWKAAVNAFSSGEPQSIDLGHITYDQGEKYFINISGMGFDAFVANKIAEKRNLGGRISVVSYYWYLVRFLFKYKVHSYTIRASDQQSTDDYFAIAIGNGKYFGGGMMPCPSAELDDGQFQITLVRKIRPLKVLLNFINLLNGKIFHLREVEAYAADRIKISADHSFQIQADGEIIKSKNAELICLPKAIQILANS